jgi:hypothetical protein
MGQRRFEESEAVIVPLVGTEPDDAARERLADAVAQALGHGLGRVDRALGILESIERDVTDPATEALVQCHRATLLVFGARFDEAAELGMGALSSVSDDSIVVRSLSPVGTSLVMSGRIDEALHQVDQMRALAWVDAQVGLTSSAIDQLWVAADLAAARGHMQPPFLQATPSPWRQLPRLLR